MTGSKAGPFRTAIRVPLRATLGGVLDRIEDRWRIDEASDHRVSGALHPTDPEGNGVEVHPGDSLDRIRSRLGPAATDSAEGDGTLVATDPAGLTVRIRDRGGY